MLGTERRRTRKQEGAATICSYCSVGDYAGIGEPRRRISRRGVEGQAAIEGRRGFEISVTVFDTLSGLSFNARSA